MDRTTTNQLVALQRRLAAWREAHGGRAHRGAPIPDELWAEATRIAARVGVGATARATRLHAGRLRERVHASAAETGSATLTTTFVELPSPTPHASVGLATPSGVSTVLVLENGHGDRVRVEVAGSDARDVVVGVASALWGRR